MATSAVLLKYYKTTLCNSARIVRIMFFDFPSAFNILQPAMLHERLQKVQVDASTTSWITDFLTIRFVILKVCMSEKVMSFTGDCAFIIPLQSVHLRLPVQLLPYSLKILR